MVDLNCDMGESYGRFQIGNDDEVMKHITSCNIACGYHGGDPLTIRKTILSALKNGVKIGAHPSFPDLQGFGRRKMEIPSGELEAMILYQIAALKGMTEAEGGQLVHVKPHGVLYNMAATDEKLAEVIVRAVRMIDETLILFGPPASKMSEVAVQFGLNYKNEVFADRNYNDDLSLVNRQQKDALITNVNQMFQHVLNMVGQRLVKTVTGKMKSISADTICIHGDQPGAGKIAAYLKMKLIENGIEVG